VRAGAKQLERRRVEHRCRDARDHVRAERLLRVEDRAHRDGLAGLEVEQRRNDCRRPRSNAIAWRLDDVSPGSTGSGRPSHRTAVTSSGLAQRASEAAQEIERNAELDVVHGCEDSFEVGGLVLEGWLVQLE